MCISDYEGTGAYEGVADGVCSFLPVLEWLLPLLV